jgi:hypothetical protein
MSSEFAITAASTSVYLAENRLGKMPFTVTNMTDQPLKGQSTVVPLDGAPVEWFRITRGAMLNLPPQRSAQVLVEVDPPLGVEALSHLFRLDVDDPSTSEDPTPGPSVELVVPPSPPRFSWKTPRGYLTTLIGASAGGAVGEILILLGANSPADKDCGADVGCAFGNAIGAAIFLLFAILAGLVLLWIGSVIGAWMGLRIRSYLGSKTTALFLAILMVPWTIAMLWLLTKITDNLVVLIIIAPILLTAVPGLLARGAVLLIRTKHL